MGICGGKEPCHVGADLIAGSPIKNPGQGQLGGLCGGSGRFGGKSSLASNAPVLVPISVPWAFITPVLSGFIFIAPGRTSFKRDGTGGGSL